MNRAAFITLLLSVFIGLLGIGVIIPVLPVFAATLGANGFALGMIMAVFSLSRGALQPVVGSWSDRWGRKQFLVGGLAIYGVVGLLIPLADGVFALICIRFLQGVGSAMIVPVAMAYMSILAPDGEEGRYMSYLNMAVFFGIGCGPMMGGFLADNWGMPAVFYSMAGLSFLAMGLVWITMPAAVGMGNGSQSRLLENIRLMSKNPRILGILLARCTTMLIPIPTMAFLPLLLASWDGVQYSGVTVGTIIACRTLVNAVLQVFFGKMADRVNQRRMLFIGCLLLALVLAAIPFCRSFSLLMVTYGLLGVVEALIWAVLGAFSSREAKGSGYGHGTIMGVYGLSMSVGVFTGGLLAGLAMDYLGVAQVYLVCAGVIAASSVPVLLLILRGDRECPLAIRS